MAVVEKVIKAFLPKHLRKPAVCTYRSWLYRGDAVACPCCEGRFTKFLPFGVTPRDNAQCPKCNLLERHRLLWFYFKERTNLFRDNLKVLHVAPETLFSERFKQLPNLDYLTVDLESELAMVKMDITQMSFPDNSFDVILCNHVLEHIPEEEKAMGELFRVLKPGGWSILQVPIDHNREITLEDDRICTPEDRQKYYGQSDHVRMYGRDYPERLGKVGFTVTVDYYAQTLDKALVERHGLSQEEIYLCHKN